MGNIKEITVRDGCVAWCRDINGYDANDIEDKKAAIMELADRIPEDYISDFVEWFAKSFYEQYGDYSMDDKPCEECGDYVETWSLKFD